MMMMMMMMMMWMMTISGPVGLQGWKPWPSSNSAQDLCQSTEDTELLEHIVQAGLPKPSPHTHLAVQA